MKYRIKYHTGVGDFDFNGTLEDAMVRADEGVCYTQENVTIEGEDGVVAIRHWWGVEADGDEGIIDYGKFGYYGPWETL